MTRAEIAALLVVLAIFLMGFLVGYLAGVKRIWKLLVEQ